MKKVLYAIILLLLFITTTNAISFRQYTYDTQDDLYNSQDTEKFFSLVSEQTENPSRIYDFIDNNGNFNNLYVNMKEDTLYWSKYDGSMKLVNTIKINMPLEYNTNEDDVFSHPFVNAIYAKNHLYILFSRLASHTTDNPNAYDEIIFGLAKYNIRGEKIAYQEYKARDFSSNYSATLSNYLAYAYQVPFYGASLGSLSYNEKDNTIGLFFAGNIFGSSSLGGSHQVSKISFFNADTLEHVSAIYDLILKNKTDRTAEEELRISKYWNIAQYNKSHSIGQRMIVTSDNQYLLAEYTDGYNGRGLLVSKIKTEINSRNEPVDNIYTHHMHYIPDIGAKVQSGNNYIFSTLGNIIELNDGYLYIGATEKELMSDTSTLRKPWQLFAQKYKKDFENNKNGKQYDQLFDTGARTVTGTLPDKTKTEPYYLEETNTDYGLKFLTDLQDKTILMVRATKIEDNKIFIIYEQHEIDSKTKHMIPNKYDIYYMIIDGEANILVEPTKIDNAKMNREENYIYKDGKIIWTTTKNKVVTINVLNLYQSHPSVFNIELPLKGDANYNSKIDLSDVLQLLKI